MRGIMHPEFQTYVREILNQFGHDSQDQNYSFQQVPIFFKSPLTLYHKLSNSKRRFKTDMQAMFL